MLQLAVLGVAALFLSWAGCALFVYFGGVHGPIDVPNERSLHVHPVPRSGGVGIVVGVLPALLWPMVDFPLFLPFVLLAVVSFMDDVRGVRPRTRLIVQFVASALFVALSDFALPWWLLVLIAIGIVWCTNLYNFMDGSDGLAGGMAVFGFGSYLLAAANAGDVGLTAVAVAVAAAAVGFLYFNFAPARIFMGDVGSVPLGFLFAAIGVSGWSSGDWSAWFPGVVFSPFIVDATVTLIRRVARGERVWAAHKTHYYQRLVRLGVGHRRTALLEYALMSGCALLALWALRRGPWVQAVVLAGLTIAYAGLAYAIDSAWRRQSKADA